MTEKQEQNLGPRTGYFILFTQYLLPNRQKREVQFDCVEDLAKKAQQIIDAGLVFESEILRTGQVSFTIADLELEEDVEIEVCNNGPDVIEAVNRLVEKGLKRIGMEHEHDQD